MLSFDSGNESDDREERSRVIEMAQLRNNHNNQRGGEYRFGRQEEEEDYSNTTNELAKSIEKYENVFLEWIMSINFK